MTNWIAVADRLPEMPVDEEGFPRSCVVLIYCLDSYIGTAHAAIYDEKVEWYSDDDYTNNYVTHWMPLPAPPLPFNASLSRQGGADAGRLEASVSPLGAEVLHCYAQEFWHTEAYLSGGRGALLALRAAIDNALRHAAGECNVFASDGEGYTVHVVQMADADAERQVVPYTDDVARQPWNGAFGPWDALRANAAISGAKHPID